MSDKRQQALKVRVEDLKSARDYFIGVDREDKHYETMIDLVKPVLDKLPLDSVPNSEDMRTFRIHWMFAVSAWNKRSYQSNKRDPLDHFDRVDEPLRKHWVSLMSFRRREIHSLVDDDQQKITEIYSDFFDELLGPVGAAKGLHLIAPKFFSPWDSKIYKGYGYKSTDYCGSYWQFLRQTQTQIQRLMGNFGNENPIKAIDRFNFWHFTRNRGEK